MKLVNFGSLNVDRVYRVEQFVRPGETVLAEDCRFFAGGKGLNQSVAAARAGARVLHAGMVGEDGGLLLETLAESGADVSLIRRAAGPSGHAVIQLDRQGQNCILVHGGANRCLTEAYVDEVLALCGPGDMVLVQNEVNLVPYIIRRAADRGLQVAFNPSPVSAAMADYPLEAVRWLILNELEGAQLAGLERAEREQGPAILEGLRRRYPAAGLVLTLGAEGVLCWDGGTYLEREAYTVPVADSTGAGDTFCGCFLACLQLGRPLEACLHAATAAAAIAVSRPGASASIPTMDEVTAFLRA